MLVVGTELPDLIDDRGPQARAGKFAILAQRVNEAMFAKFFALGAEGFSNAVRVEDKGVARRKLAFGHAAIPILKGAEDGGGGIETIQGIVIVQE